MASSSPEGKVCSKSSGVIAQVPPSASLRPGGHQRPGKLFDPARGASSINSPEAEGRKGSAVGETTALQAKQVAGHPGFRARSPLLLHGDSSACIVF